MSLARWILPALALGTATMLLTPRASNGFSLNGCNLTLSQRNVYVFNNFADVSANDNQTLHPDYPGHQGAVMAIWKSSVEWGSEIHGSGNGDPHQPGDLGSGGANFDAYFAGVVSSVGGLHSNTHSAISGGAGGVLSFFEGDCSGWRIRYYESVQWSDGPGTPAATQIDLQAIATREYGFAIGLGHSSAIGATMSPTIAGGLINARSISNDDSAGVQAIYGTASGFKPHVSGYTVTGNSFTVHGTGFDLIGNEIWFTQGGKLTNLASTGTAIIATLPLGVGPGDLLVRRNSMSHAGLSNAFPFDPPPTCGTTQSGLGFGGANIGDLNTTDSPQLGSTINLVASNFNGTSVGTLLFALTPSSTPLLGGTILVDLQNPVALFPIAISGGQGTTPVNLPATAGLAYLTVHAQVGTLDGTQAFGWAFSNRLNLTFCP